MSRRWYSVAMNVIWLLVKVISSQSIYGASMKRSVQVAQSMRVEVTQLDDEVNKKSCRGRKGREWRGGRR